MDYLEFCDENMHRHYPLADGAIAISTLGVRLPDSFLADLRISVAADAVEGFTASFYVSKVTVDHATVGLEVSSSVLTGVIARLSGIPVGLTSGDTIAARTFELVPGEDHPEVAGQLIVGSCADVRNLLGIHTFIHAAGKLLPTTIFPQTNTVSGIQVGDHVLTGVVTLIAGDNCTIEADLDTNSITISYGDPAEGNIVTSDDLLEAVLAEFGMPILTINGVTPDGTGDFEFRGMGITEGSEESEVGDCISIVSGTNSIIISNVCNPPCNTKEELSLVYSRIGELNRGFSVLQQNYSAIARNYSVMLARLSAFSENRQGG